MISESELAGIREAQNRLLPQEVLLLRPTFIAPNEYEDRIVQEKVRVRLTPGFGRFRIVADRYQAITPFTVTFEFDAEVNPGDKVVDEEARIFEIREVRRPGSLLTAVQTLADLVNG